MLPSLYPALMPVLPLLRQLLLHTVSQTVVFAFHLLVASFFSPPPTHQQDFVMSPYISPESTSELLSILIKYAQLSISFRTTYCFDPRLVTTVASLKEMRVCRVLTSVGMRL